jgi:uncharacterized membrane protein YfcA
MSGLLLAAGGAGLAATLQSATGIGFALVLTPVLLTGLSPAAAILTVTLLGLELNLLVLGTERRSPVVAWTEVAPVLIAAVPGAAAGVLLLHALPRATLQVAVGVAVLVLVGLQGRRPSTGTGSPVPPPRGSRAGLPRAGVGALAGLLTTSSGFSGPPLALWFSHRGLLPEQLRDSLSASYLVLGGVGAAALAPLVPQAHLRVVDLGGGAAGVLVGHAAGSRLFRRLGADQFRPLLLTVIAAAGLVSLVTGLSSVV